MIVCSNEDADFVPEVKGAVQATYNHVIRRPSELLGSPISSYPSRGSLDVRSIPMAVRLCSSSAVLPLLENWMGPPKDHCIVASSRFTKRVVTATAMLPYTTSHTPVSGPVPTGPTYQQHGYMKSGENPPEWVYCFPTPSPLKPLSDSAILFFSQFAFPSEPNKHNRLGWFPSNQSKISLQDSSAISGRSGSSTRSSPTRITGLPMSLAITLSIPPRALGNFGRHTPACLDHSRNPFGR
ncbi:hypothetical protein Acr_00g0079300 [Actinidia rufa]|uniref:Uncharacterized protein n=1 Tax=Actinidia rufa TaxID=165716 RepID=A0A7J0DTR2_9ERIC|nr:hypothetical protein Acr_00g0079300 [Actinidia rufa]